MKLQLMLKTKTKKRRVNNREFEKQKSSAQKHTLLIVKKLTQIIFF